MAYKHYLKENNSGAATATFNGNLYVLLSLRNDKHRHPPSSVLKRVAHYAVKTLQNYRPFVCLSLRDSLQFRRYEKWRSLPCSSDYSCFRHMNVRSTNLRHTNLSTPCRLVHTSKSSLLQLRCQVKLPTSELPTISVPTFKVNTASSVHAWHNILAFEPLAHKSHWCEGCVMRTW